MPSSLVSGQRFPVPGLPSQDRCLVMGVVNVTPDSFSDGGAWLGADAAVAHGLELAAQGADIVDVGGESTRPGAQRISAEEEIRRVQPVIAELARSGVPVSVDTMRARVAELALEAGARLVNDVSGGLADPHMPRLVAKASVPYVVMHWRGHSHDMNSRAVYDDVVREVCDELRRRVDAVVAEGVDPSMIVLDPGLGFSKLSEHNWRLLAALPRHGQGRGSRSGPGRLRPRRRPGRRRSAAPVPGARRRLPQALPGAAARDGRRHAEIVYRQRRCHGGHDRARRGRGCLVRARPQGPGQRRRRTGRRGLACRGRERGRERGRGPAMRTDSIEVRGLRVRGRHGVLDAERRDGQEFLIDAVLAVDTRPAAASDDLSLTVDYAGLSERLAAIVAGSPVNLIETLAERLAQACLADPAVRQAEITVHKPNAPMGRPFGDVSVTISRERPVRVVIALGSNLGDRLRELQRAVDALAATPGLIVTAVSPVYETAPVGGPQQPDYLNAVVLAETSRPAADLLHRAHAIEAAAQRNRDVHWGPRTLDVDIVAYGEELNGDPVLTLPHPRAQERAFVLAPWRDADPGAVLPGRGRVATLLANLPDGGIRRRDDMALRRPA